MFLPEDLPSDSVLRRHALTEYQRLLGLPPTDSVLRRHFEHLPSSASRAAPVLPAAASSSHDAPRSHAQAPARASSGGGLMGWLRRLFGG